MKRKAQFFIITAVLVAGSLSITTNVLDDYTGIAYDETSTSSAPAQFRSIQQNVDALWYEQRWQYEKSVIVFERAGRDVDDYPVSVDLDTETLIDQGKMQDDCGDLRVVEDGREIPYQIEAGSCNTTETTLWFLTSVRTDSRDDDVALYYGNPDVEAPDYPTDIQVNEDEEAFRNDVITFEAGTNPDGEYGFIQGRQLDGPNLVQGNIVFEGDPTTDDFEVLEQGPVYMTFRFNSTHNYTIFSENNFLRRNGNITVDSDSTFWYGEGNRLLTHWEAGNSNNQHEIQFDDTWTGSFAADQLPYIGSVNTTSGDGIMMMTDTTSLDSSLDEYTGTGGTQDGRDDRMGFGPSTGSIDIPHLDISFENDGLQEFRADIHANPPLVVLGDDEEAGSFAPTAGWRNKVRVTLQEHSGTTLSSYPVNISLNLGSLDVRDDCQDLIAVENGERVPHLLRDQCDSKTFDEPDGFTARWPMDEGEGSYVNDTSDTFQAQFDGTPRPDWEPARFGSGLALEEGSYITLDEDPPLELRNSDFAVTLWFRADMTEQDFTDPVELLQYPSDTPGLHIINQTGDYLLQGRFRNESDDLTTVNGFDDIQDRSGEWHHAALHFNRSGGNMSLFLDGDFQGAETVEGDLAFDSNELTIGDGFSGVIDEYKIYTILVQPDAIEDQATTSTTVTVATNLTAFGTESNLDIFAGNTAGLNISYDPEDIQPDSWITDPSDRPEVVSTTEPRSYSDVIERLGSRLDSSTSAQVDLEVISQCTEITFDSDGFTLEDRVC